jgi:hypothetical protein
MMLANGIGLYKARINSKPLTTHQTFGHAALQDRLEQLSKHITLPESPVPVLEKGGMIRYLALQAKPAKPSIGQIEMYFFAQAPL